MHSLVLIINISLCAIYYYYYYSCFSNNSRIDNTLLSFIQWFNVICVILNYCTILHNTIYIAIYFNLSLNTVNIVKVMLSPLRYLKKDVVTPIPYNFGEFILILDLLSYVISTHICIYEAIYLYGEIYFRYI